MNELYEAIEKKLRMQDIQEIFPEQMCMMISVIRLTERIKESIILLSKFEDDVVFEYHITIQEEDFNLGILKMKTPEGEFVADFDE